MEGLRKAFPLPKRIERSPEGALPRTTPTLLRIIQDEGATLLRWLEQHALGICGATGDLITECAGCKDVSNNGEDSRKPFSSEDLIKYLRASRFWYQKKDRTGPHQHEFPVAILALLHSIHTLSSVAG